MQAWEHLLVAAQRELLLRQLHGMGVRTLQAQAYEHIPVQHHVLVAQIRSVHLLAIEKIIGKNRVHD